VNFSRAGVLCALVLCAAPARAWEAKAKDVAERIRSRPHPMSAPQKKTPGWVKRTFLEKAKPYWAERWNKKTYLFAIGWAEDIENSALLHTVAEDRARANLALGMQDLGLTPKGKFGETHEEHDKRVETILVGSQVLDWYLGTGARMYALVVVLP
jgi:hypothetical protein